MGSPGPTSTGWLWACWTSSFTPFGLSSCVTTHLCLCCNAECIHNVCIHDAWSHDLLPWFMYVCMKHTSMMHDPWPWCTVHVSYDHLDACMIQICVMHLSMILILDPDGCTYDPGSWSWCTNSFMMQISSDHLDAYLMQTWMTNISMIMVLDLDTIICANVQICIYGAENFVTNQPTNKGILGVGLESYTFLHFLSGRNPPPAPAK